MRKIITFIACILFVVGVGVAITAATVLMTKNNQENDFAKEMQEYKALFNAKEPDLEKISERAKDIRTSGYYMYVELAAKEYLRDVFGPFLAVKQSREGLVFKDGITKELIEAGQPEFKDALAAIDDMQTNIELLRVTASISFSEEAAIGYLEGDLEDYYTELLLDQVSEVYTDTQLKQQFLVYASQMQEQHDIYKEAIDFLVAHNGSWHLENDVVVFKTTALTNQYNQILAKLDQKEE